MDEEFGNDTKAIEVEDPQDGLPEVRLYVDSYSNPENEIIFDDTHHAPEVELAIHNYPLPEHDDGYSDESTENSDTQERDEDPEKPKVDFGAIHTKGFFLNNEVVYAEECEFDGIIIEEESVLFNDEQMTAAEQASNGTEVSVEVLTSLGDKHNQVWSRQTFMPSDTGFDVISHFEERPIPIENADSAEVVADDAHHPKYDDSGSDSSLEDSDDTEKEAEDKDSEKPTVDFDKTFSKKYIQRNDEFRGAKCTIEGVTFEEEPSMFNPEQELAAEQAFSGTEVTIWVLTKLGDEENEVWSVQKFVPTDGGFEIVSTYEKRPIELGRKPTQIDADGHTPEGDAIDTLPGVDEQAAAREAVEMALAQGTPGESDARDKESDLADEQGKTLSTGEQDKSNSDADSQPQAESLDVLNAADKDLMQAHDQRGASGPGEQGESSPEVVSQSDIETSEESLEKKTVSPSVKSPESGEQGEDNSIAKQAVARKDVEKALAKGEHDDTESVSDAKRTPDTEISQPKSIKPAATAGEPSSAAERTAREAVAIALGIETARPINPPFGETEPTDSSGGENRDPSPRDIGPTGGGHDSDPSAGIPNTPTGEKDSLKNTMPRNSTDPAEPKPSNIVSRIKKAYSPSKTAKKIFSTPLAPKVSSLPAERTARSPEASAKHNRVDTKIIPPVTRTETTANTSREATRPTPSNTRNAEALPIESRVSGAPIATEKMKVAEQRPEPRAYHHEPTKINGTASENPKPVEHTTPRALDDDTKTVYVSSRSRNEQTEPNISAVVENNETKSTGSIPTQEETVNYSTEDKPDIKLTTSVSSAEKRSPRSFGAPEQPITLAGMQEAITSMRSGSEPSTAHDHYKSPGMNNPALTMSPVSTDLSDGWRKENIYGDLVTNVTVDPQEKNNHVRNRAAVAKAVA